MSDCRSELERSLSGFLFGMLLAALMVPGLALADRPSLPRECGSIGNHYGPFDYNLRKDKLLIVEQVHFTPEIENLIRGRTGSVATEIDYTLRAFPNHHRALSSMMRLVARNGDKPKGARYTMECYLARAEYMSPHDAVVKMLFGIYRMKQGKMPEAISYLEKAEAIAGVTANLEYNLGLAYARAKMFDKALEKAHKAYALGFDLPGLRNILEREGQWRDPEPTAPVKGNPEGDPGKG